MTAAFIVLASLAERGDDGTRGVLAIGQPGVGEDGGAMTQCGADLASLIKRDELLLQVPSRP